MAFKNIHTAINQELGRIAGVQHHAWGIRNRTTVPEQKDFDQWFLEGIRTYQKKGIEFEFLCPGLVKIIRGRGIPNQLRTVLDFEREYQQEYLSHFY